MATNWGDENSHFRGNSGVSIPIDTLLEAQETTHHTSRCSDGEFLASQELREDSLSENPPSLDDEVLQSAMETVTRSISNEDHPSTDMVSESASTNSDGQQSPFILGNEQMLGRKSERKRQEKRAYSPDLSNSISRGSMMNKRRKRKFARVSAAAFTSPDRLFDRLPNGEPFRCDLCKSPYVCNPLSKRTSKLKRSRHTPSPRHKIDRATGKELLLCNACGLAFDRPKQPRKERILPRPEEKEKYLQDARSFAVALAADLNDPDAERLCCPNFKARPCGCLQKYLSANGNLDETKQRTVELLAVLKDAKRLSAQKCYNVEEIADAGKKSRKARNIGLGNGQKRSKAFEEYVMIKRAHLRQNLKLCERATQRVLMYSNNFLHKKLKTEERGCRAKRVKGKAALGLLPDLTNLHTKKCCIDNCVLMVLTHGRLLQSWRARAISGQMEARRVLAEMLTPSGGARSNCYKFISWVTGCSHSTIGRVNEQMKRTGGDREPPVHGLKKYWQQNPRMKEKDTDENSIDAVGVEVMADPIIETSEAQPVPGTTANLTSSSTISTISNYQLEAHRQHLVELHRHLVEQQMQIQQQQQVVQQQILQQSLLQQLCQTDNNQNSTLLQQIMNQLSQAQSSHSQLQTATTAPQNGLQGCSANTVGSNLLQMHLANPRSASHQILQQNAVEAASSDHAATQVVGQLSIPSPPATLDCAHLMGKSLATQILARQSAVESTSFSQQNHHILQQQMSNIPLASLGPASLTSDYTQVSQPSQKHLALGIPTSSSGQQLSPISSQKTPPLTSTLSPITALPPFSSPMKLQQATVETNTSKMAGLNAANSIPSGVGVCCDSKTKSTALQIAQPLSALPNNKTPAMPVTNLHAILQHLINLTPVPTNDCNGNSSVTLNNAVTQPNINVVTSQNSPTCLPMPQVNITLLQQPLQPLDTVHDGQPADSTQNLSPQNIPALNFTLLIHPSAVTSTGLTQTASTHVEPVTLTVANDSHMNSTTLTTANDSELQQLIQNSGQTVVDSTMTAEVPVPTLQTDLTHLFSSQQGVKIYFNSNSLQHSQSK